MRPISKYCTNKLEDLVYSILKLFFHYGEIEMMSS